MPSPVMLKHIQEIEEYYRSFLTKNLTEPAMEIVHRLVEWAAENTRLWSGEEAPSFDESHANDALLWSFLTEKTEAVNLDGGPYTGLLYQYPVADGYASYVLVDTHLVWIAAGEYHLPGPHLDGLTLSHLKNKERQRRSLNAIFSKETP